MSGELTKKYLVGVIGPEVIEQLLDEVGQSYRATFSDENEERITLLGSMRR
jgi:hypothetical protein